MIKNEKDLFMYELPSIAEHIGSPLLQRIIGRYVTYKIMKKFKRYKQRKQREALIDAIRAAIKSKKK